LQLASWLTVACNVDDGEDEDEGEEGRKMRYIARGYIFLAFSGNTEKLRLDGSYSVFCRSERYLEDI
jgi:hypothetical protein